ncbi:hypothetical protein Taro_028783 [Colocasia esculenta]|uniref:Uncharacterized protein n=1 Tax=Colocasia esculenta TaxID=4460 RepID=A0A843VYA5_COLES|nr:hypothetical protein [Colocasia esculenta]
MVSTQLASPEDETRPTEFSVGLEADGVNITDVPEDKTRPTKFSVGLKADGANTTGVPRR